MPGKGFIPTITTKGINQIKKGNCKKKNKFHAYKRFITFLKILVQFCVGAIPRPPIIVFTRVLQCDSVDRRGKGTLS